MRCTLAHALLILLLVLSACGGKRSTETTRTNKPRAERIDIDRKGNIKLRGEIPVSLKGKRPGDRLQRGTASWYGRPYHGRKAANGERYDMWELTAAHKTLPFNTLLTVVRRDNGRRVTVRITDRGPFIRGRIIDLSRKAARSLDMEGDGVAEVDLILKKLPAGYVANRRTNTPSRQNPNTSYDRPPTKPNRDTTYDRKNEPQHTPAVDRPAAGFWTIQVGSFQEKKRAEAMRRRMQILNPHVTIQEADGFWRVRVGQFTEKVHSFDLAQRLSDEGIKPWILFAEE